MAAADAKSIGDAIDVVEPGSNQCDLKNRAIVETSGAEAVEKVGANAGGVAGQLNDIFAHEELGGGNGRGAVVLAKRVDQFLIESDATQKLCVGFDSIPAPIRDGDDGGDHFVLAALEGKVGRHQRAERGERVVKSVRNQSVGGDDSGGAVLLGKNRSGILLGIEFAASFHCIEQILVCLRQRNRLNPSHTRYLRWTEKEIHSKFRGREG